MTCEAQPSHMGLHLPTQATALTEGHIEDICPGKAIMWDSFVFPAEGARQATFPKPQMLPARNHQAAFNQMVQTSTNLTDCISFFGTLKQTEKIYFLQGFSVSLLPRDPLGKAVGKQNASLAVMIQHCLHIRVYLRCSFGILREGPWGLQAAEDSLWSCIQQLQLECWGTETRDEI